MCKTQTCNPINAYDSTSTRVVRKPDWVLRLGFPYRTLPFSSSKFETTLNRCLSAGSLQQRAWSTIVEYVLKEDFSPYRRRRRGTFSQGRVPSFPKWGIGYHQGGRRCSVLIQLGKQVILPCTGLGQKDLRYSFGLI